MRNPARPLVLRWSIRPNLRRGSLGVDHATKPASSKPPIEPIGHGGSAGDTYIRYGFAFAVRLVEDEFSWYAIDGCLPLETIGRSSQLLRCPVVKRNRCGLNSTDQWHLCSGAVRFQDIRFGFPFAIWPFYFRNDLAMSTADVRSIDSLGQLRQTLLALSADWSDCLHQIKYAARRIEERFSTEVPAHWKHQVELAERSLSEALDNLSRYQTASSGVSAGDSEARLRVNKAKRRLAFCQDKQRRAKQLAMSVQQVCQDLAGPVAEVTMHTDVNLPAAAAELARMIDLLSRYAEIGSQTLQTLVVSETPRQAPPSSEGTA